VKKESVNEVVRQRVAEIPEGKIFGYDVFGELAVTRRRALARALAWLVEHEEIERAYRGTFYRPRWCKYGALGVGEGELIRSLGNVYRAGHDAHNALGISTQVPFVIEVAHPTWHHKRKLKYLNVRFVRSTLKEIPDDADYLLLMILDAIKNIKHIADASPDDVVNRLLWIIKRFEKEKVEKLVEYALHYPPRVRAILGAILEHARHKRLRSVLKATLNPQTEYLVGLKDSLPNLRKWKLVGPGRSYRAWERRWKKRRNEAQALES
jgi:hypothetical protein